MAATDAILPASIGRKMINAGMIINNDKSIETSAISFEYTLGSVMFLLGMSFGVL